MITIRYILIDIFGDANDLKDTMLFDWKQLRRYDA
uniref:Uncharacterized protein n=1 Tax=Moniliophthora roreri TaxID=221103 RepID=A0A0W0GEN4_MONRR